MLTTGLTNNLSDQALQFYLGASGTIMEIICQVQDQLHELCFENKDQYQ